MLDIIQFIKQIFALWIFCWWLLVWLLIYLESYLLSFGDLSPGKQTPSSSEKLILLLLISPHFSLKRVSAPIGPFSHDLCLSLQMGKGRLSKTSTGMQMSLKLSSWSKWKKTPGSRASFRKKLGSLFSVLLSGKEWGLHDGLENMASYQHRGM